MDFRHTLIARAVSFIVLLLFSWTFAGVYDVAYAVKNSGELFNKDNRVRTIRGKTAAGKFEEAVERMEEALADPSLEMKDKKGRLAKVRSEMERLAEKLREEFGATEKKLREDGLPPEILDRHHDFVKRFEENLDTVLEHIESIDRAATHSDFDKRVGKALEHVKKAKPPKKHVPLDPDNLPHRAAEPTRKEPRLKKEEFINGMRAQAEPILVASTGSLAGLLDENSQYMQLALAVGLPGQADLAETVEIKFTPAIQTRAEELGGRPLAIYEWVRNNVEFVPTWGSIQGADYCLQTMQCNAFDTASLLIALLRASGIPARYAMGTVEMPMEKVMNWAGGFTDANAALNFMASGGIPAGGLVEGGRIKVVQMEHVWVEAWIDYIPSRGARHRQGGGDTWIPLDASFKQYAYTDGMDVSSAVPFDAEGFADALISSAIINETDGYVTGVDSAYIQQAMSEYQAQVSDYITTNHPDATVGDVLGKNEIIVQKFPYLLGTLPYRLRVTGARYSSMPDSYRHKIEFYLAAESIISGSMPISITRSLPELAGRKITLSYSPATPEDEAVINSYLPEPHPDGTPIDPSEFPSSLPAYLINLKPELRMDGEVAATGGAIGMGHIQKLDMTFTSPSHGSGVVANKVNAGEYFGIALDLAGISGPQMEAVKAKLESTKAKLESGNYEGLTKDDVLGDLLYATALSYFAELDAMDHVQARTMGVVDIRLPSENIFKTALEVEHSFGVPVSVSAGGLAMDADRMLSLSKARDGDYEKKRQFMLASGMNSSALEHSVPEQLFSTPENPVEGISAVKALQIANGQGIPIYTVTRDNIAAVFPQLQLDPRVINDILNAVNAGMEVTVSKTDITYNGWIGCGYLVINPLTGSGGYMISGGASGAVLLVLTLIFSLLAIVTAAPTGGIGAVFFGMHAIATLEGAIAALYGKDKLNEFMNCLVKSVAKIIVKDKTAHYLKPYLIPAVAVLLPYILSFTAGWSIGKCISDTFYN